MEHVMETMETSSLHHDDHDYHHPMYDYDHSSSTFSLSTLARELAAYGKKKKYPLDYTVLKVAILTLVLLLGVELIRHKIHLLSENRPFFHHVVQLFYHELATLGIVEFGIWLLLTYHPTLNIVQEKLFARVHFMFFYSALLNAIQSVVLAIASFSVSNRLWVQTEKLELGHYVSIRKKFKEVEHTLIPNEADVDDDELAEEIFQLKKWWRHFKRRVAHPHLARKYHDLLVQVRFHELRYHFITANHLPLKFHVSEYLEGAQVKVLNELVHISAFAWLSLMGFLTLIYFTMSMVASKDPFKTGLAMQVIFLGACVLCVMASVCIVQKVTWIFSQIMHMKLIDTTGKNDEGMELDPTHSSSSTPHTPQTEIPSVSRQANIKLGPGEQLKLFWLKDPRFIIGAIQLMQFGFSLFTAMLLIFWGDINVKTTELTGPILSVVLLLTWVLFTAVMAHVIPRFTLCTNLGQLVDTTLLRENLAKYYLDDALRKRRQQMEADEAENEMRRAFQENKKSLRKSESLSVSSLLLGRMTNSSKTSSAMASVHEEFDAERRQQFADLVMMSTENLPNIEESKEERRRRRRKKGVSDSTAIMRMRMAKSTMDISPVASSVNLKDENSGGKPGDRGYSSDGEEEEKKQNRVARRRARKKAVSTGVELMRSPISTLYAENDGNNSLTPNSSAGDLQKTSFLSNSGVVPAQAQENLPLGISSRKSSMSSLHSVPEEEDQGEPEVMEPRIPSVTNDSLSVNMSRTSNIQPVPEDSQVEPPVKSSMFAPLEMGETDHMPVLPVPRVIEEREEEHHASIFSKETQRSFLSSGLYKELSSVCGTLFCFFMVAVRMDILLVESGATKENVTVATIPGSLAFWFEVAWLILFLLVSLRSFHIFCPGAGYSGSPVMCIAAVSDFILSATCLTLLLVAEGQRTSGTFGSEERLVDGLGTIEPFTGLIALRVLRYIWAEQVICLWERFNSSGKKHDDDESEHKANSYHEKDHDHGSHGGKEVVVEQWRAAIALHPEIVDTYGAFSSELLQTMLGIPLVEGASNASNHSMATNDNVKGRQTMKDRYKRKTSSASLQKKGSNTKSDSDHEREALQLIKGCYSKLPSETKAVILSGLVQKPMRCVSSVKSQEVNFEFDAQRNAREFQADVEGDLSMLVEPNASLVRSMRRCERRIPPFVNEWSVVDVVITQFEIVLLEASYDLFGHNGAAVSTVKQGFAKCLTSPVREDNREESEVKSDKNISETRAQVCSAIVATEGGKKLRLRDIVAGRNIVGHIDLSTVEVVKVERHPAKTGSASVSERVDQKNAFLSEYWGSPPPGNKGRRLHETEFHSIIHERWQRVDEHRLRIRSAEGTMYLRFFSDLEEAEIKALVPSRMKGRSLQRNDTFLWCQTIGRVCGKGQLKQKLPHFGDLGDDELNDYLELVDDSKEEHGSWMKFKNAVGGGFLSHSRHSHVEGTSSEKTDDMSAPLGDANNVVAPLGASSSGDNDDGDVGLPI